jgi:hypothetical protein
MLYTAVQSRTSGQTELARATGFLVLRSLGYFSVYHDPLTITMAGTNEGKVIVIEDAVRKTVSPQSIDPT